MGQQSSVPFKASDYYSPRFWPMWCIIGLLRLVSLLPYPAGLAVGRALGRLVFLLSRSRQRIVDINLERCFPEKSLAERNRIKTEYYQNMGISIIELAMCWWWPPSKLERLVEIEGREHLDAVLDSGRGVILLSGHFTSLEIGGRLLVLSVPMQVMYRTQRNELFDSYLFTRRNSYFVNTVSRKNTRQLIRGIKQGVPTWYAPDQDFSRERNVFAPFMGIETATITAGSRLAAATGAAMLPFYPVRKKDDSGYLLRIEPPLPDFPSGDDLKDATAINHTIEKIVRRYPESYMWIHQRFKTRPPGEPPFYQ
ncbi:MAG: LpxL/LpxP family Kdo(2)-lipid IV(A) lauroyl/palmitoleoyl acyltransferase [Gammaproteobacteria bacterium]|nr:LpxL/LpxP family Kdo(2)-lipid IV(A) lauroyl/palmitoleoyl acyltransferase [Gammaproteobacteria bacterium]MDH3448516.1 LpxL/LpxP family Kdo(2)-lipid IV(A) lauroyl/palmitoleoyl acyltransferase [Gammaproteobacteria bacterium]